jgi:hypothetical protein
MVVLYRWRHGTQAKHSSSDDVRRTVREGIYYDQGTGIGAISFDLARWHGGWKCSLGCSNPARRSCGGAFRSSRRLLVSLLVMVWYPFEESKQADLIPSCKGSCCRTDSPRVDSGWSHAGEVQLQLSARHRRSWHPRSQRIRQVEIPAVKRVRYRKPTFDPVKTSVAYF